MNTQKEPISSMVIGYGCNNFTCCFINTTIKYNLCIHCCYLIQKYFKQNHKLILISKSNSICHFALFSEKFVVIILYPITNSNTNKVAYCWQQQSISQFLISFSDLNILCVMFMSVKDQNESTNNKMREMNNRMLWSNYIRHL